MGHWATVGRPLISDIENKGHPRKWNEGGSDAQALPLWGHSVSGRGPLKSKVTPCCLLAKPLASAPRGVRRRGRPRGPVCSDPLSELTCFPLPVKLINLSRGKPLSHPPAAQCLRRDSWPRGGHCLGCRTILASVFASFIFYWSHSHRLYVLVLTPAMQ